MSEDTESRGAKTPKEGERSDTKEIARDCGKRRAQRTRVARIPKVCFA